ncbi:pantoate--beta-alanine ligase [Snodgrassella communis]|uniref:Pantothenate synthetase n=1 Tax=Snodgrassella communis TaxID=2946699 RepID=A0A066TAN0_9NEIS|nr:pantoate--beta-alanine ligase [Snodgrassella communis]KDN11900.1 Pantoate--beta-alanine ligase [Snodgrassella communis]KDN14764.1 Pantoate--beta-alanine ligase [Snodgrassella communis]PIT07523.1 pantoate--beta-alanine ligase [Snodgrassella communis]PIT28072.1 pantoate--beta-alanine ligase [Snodgrassella communis]PIT30166.1 pantoate--beta-alanine ligase [Snodgrassella communis]
MHLIHTITELRSWRQEVKRVALVPTMGNLHEGHLSLVRTAKAHAHAVVVSIFVNRIQFGVGEDFDRYPRTLEQDVKKLTAAGADVVFAPAESELYPNGMQRYFVEPPAIQNELCGRSRPGHFRGVATVVTKLFNIVQPDVACFGKKDYQQLAVIKGMVQDLNMNIEIIPVEIERAETGLALSSRNGYLTEDERAQAAQLSACLRNMAKAIEAGNRDFAALENDAVMYLQQHGWQVDYIEVRQAQTLTKAQISDNHLVIVAAAVLGNTRLIDNIEVCFSH